VRVDDRIQRLEEAVAFQDDSIERLNRDMDEQKLAFHKLLERLEMLEAQVAGAQAPAVIAPKDDVPPPHY
jgi:uncharacterized coiled-coil protein SlyX